MNIKIYKKGEDIQLSKNFHLSEYECHCSDCTETHVDLDHVEKLQKYREKKGIPIKINSAYRCPQHNKNVGGADNSLHVKGCATDIDVIGLSPKDTANGCEHFDGLGRYKNFTHIDSRGYKARWGHN